ncbi:serine/threonine protein kinase [Solihabitans fulvus]|uniref:non-specific serine/threonine protein kinase n=1 Tax=Solihabitans fulvus TaxID=1892852 RepID=A0A5B2XD38_9PSEU|nr:serine/threonine-protein kinase [Solihabitans fulvus]KAA2261094.1 serine/threonine protein kinase [Solihabitans fulvus]
MARNTQPGRVVGGRYRLIETVGSGGFGQVWHAHDEDLDIDVAVKEVWLPPAVSDAEQEERLSRAKREARNAVRLRDHPNIVTVYDVVIEDEAPWIVMQFVTGRSLAQQVGEHGPLPGDAAARIAAALLTALGAAHDAGIVHRDVKPANVLLADNGDVLLADFGIAVHQSDTAITVTGAFIGSMEYVAPERARGEHGGPPCDLYSLGVTLYHAVEGVSPFRRDNPVATLHAVLFEQAAPPSQAGALAPLITKLLDKDPDRRPTIQEARALLDSPPPLVATPSMLAAPPPTLVATPSTPADAPPIQYSMPPPIGGPPPRAAGNKHLAAWGAVAAVVCVALLVMVLVPWHLGPFRSGSSTEAQQPAVGQTYDPVVRSTTREPSAPPTTPTTRAARPTTPTFDPASLDRETADRTPLTAAAQLPESFTDSKNVRYTLRGSGVHNCVNEFESDSVQSVLRSVNCGSEISGEYIDEANKILVSVVVAPLADTQTAASAHDQLKQAYSNAWGIWCPKDGPGSQICNDNEDISRATQAGYVTNNHRYLIHALALYINLGVDPDVEQWVDAAAHRAVDVVGPDNYSGNH